MKRIRRTQQGRYVACFFVHSELAPNGEELEHAITLQCGSLLRYEAKVHSEIAGKGAEYVCGDAEKLKWVVAFDTAGSALRRDARPVAVSSTKSSPLVRTVTLQFKREDWVCEESEDIHPAIELVIETMR